MNLSELIKKSGDLYEELHNTHVDFYHFWMTEVLFTWRWWMAVILIIIPWALWFLVKKRESSSRLLQAGFFVMVLSSGMDMIGIAMGLWYYPVNVFPVMPEFIPFDICAFPVTTMLFIQFFPNVHPIIKAVIYALLGSFVFQPLNKLIGLYYSELWKDYYSFPILIFIYLTSNHLASKNNFSELK